MSRKTDKRNEIAILKDHIAILKDNLDLLRKEISHLRNLIDHLQTQQDNKTVRFVPTTTSEPILYPPYIVTCRDTSS